MCGFYWPHAASVQHLRCCCRHTDIYSSGQLKERKLNGANTSNVYYFTSVCMCVCIISNMKSLGIVGVNYTESDIGTEDTACTLC